MSELDRQDAAADGTVDLQMCQQVIQAVRNDIRQVLGDSWELQQMNHTAPKARQATLDRLALPKKARVQQQVTHNLHNVCDFANWKAEQLAKRRAAAAATEADLQMEQAAQREALEGWHRQRQQLGQQLYQQQQQQLQHHKQQAKIISTLAAQRAQADLQQIKQVQERKKIHAAELRAQIGKQRMDTK